MAVTKIWAVKDSLQRVLDYAANPQKTALAGDGLARALHYAGNDAKTRLAAADMDGEQVLLVSGIHCRAGQAWADMQAVQRQFGKTGGTVALHAYQSFRPGEVTPRQCHDIGVELARRVWGSRFQVLVATHQNTNCLHNHFVINSVSYVDGKKYEQRRSQYAELRAASDEICRKYRLSVLEQPGGKTSRTLYQAERRGEPTRYAQMRAAIRYAMRETSTEADFAAVLRERGFVWQHEPRRKYPTLRPVDGGRAVRIYRLGADCDWPAICQALDENYDRHGPRFYARRHDPWYTLRLPVEYRSLRHARCRGRWPTLWERTRRQSGLWRLYMYYCYQLGIYPKRPAPRVNWPEIRAIWRDIDCKLNELNFVTDHGFAGLGAVRAYRQQTAEHVEVLTKQRDACARALRRKVPPPDARAKRDELTRQLAELRREVRLCDRVIDRVTRTRTCREQLHLQTQWEREQEQARRARYRGRER